MPDAQHPQPARPARQVRRSHAPVTARSGCDSHRASYLRTDTYREALERVGRPVVVHEPTSHAALRFVEQAA